LSGIYDVLVVGGGVNGTGVARDCAMRGLRTALVEKRDLSGGTTGTCSGMIHGGGRYLEYDVKTTETSCRDSGYIQRIAPHLLFRIPFLTPVLPDDRYDIEKVETFFEAYDKFAPLKNSKPHVRLTQAETLSVEPGLISEIVGSVSFDEWGISPFRLCVANAVSAAERGATIMNHARIVGLLQDERDRVVGAVVRDAAGRREIHAKLVVNCMGPWAPQLCEMAGVKLRLRPAKGTHIVFDRRITNVGMALEAIDGRAILLLPHENTTILGTTDDDYYGDLDNVVPTYDEIEYLLQAGERFFPTIRQYRIVRAFAGVRPTLYEWRPNEDMLSREHEVFDHEVRDGVGGIITLAGGKLASYRLMAEHTTDVVCRKLGVDEPCTTHLEFLPGGEGEVDVPGLAREHGLPLHAISRMASRHGTRVETILRECGSGGIVCDCEPVTEAELRYCITHEWAVHLDDLRRRTRLGAGPCQGMRCTLRAARILAEERGLSRDEMLGEVDAFLNARWKGKRPVLRSKQVAQEEMAQAHWRGLYEDGV